MKILLLGGSGTLGKELLKINPDMIAPPRDEVDVSNSYGIGKYISGGGFDLVINAAAMTDNRALEKSPARGIDTNIMGAACVASACIRSNIRLVCISTDYVYKGDRGNYKESDEILPFNLYAWTKLGGECSARGVKNHLIIRTSFGKSTFDYPESFTDKWSSKDYVDRIAPMIYEAAISTLTGVINIGTDRKTLYDHAIERNKKVKGVRIADTSFHTPYDTSMNLQRWMDFKNNAPVCRPHTKCRVCGSEDMEKYLDLGMMPLANNLEITSERARNQERYPLQVMLCKACGLSQLSVVIDPSVMFSYYTYRSSVNKGYVQHCREMARVLMENFHLNKDSFHIDIAGNDGTLLKEFKDEIGHRVLNVDPASNLTAIAEANGVPSLATFWNKQTAEAIVEKYGKADLITATNVFAHVDDVRGFLEGVKIALADNGTLILEFPYMIDFIEGVEFDTIYFEHLSYFSIGPLAELCKYVGLKMLLVEKQEIHGGTIRVFICHDTINESPTKGIEWGISKENEFLQSNKYHLWANAVKSAIDNFGAQVLDLKKKGYKIAAFAASAKGNTLLNCTGMNTDMIAYIADETPEKIGKFSPGTGIPIVNKQRIETDPPDYLIILSWNFAEEIIAKLSDIYKGKYIIPVFPDIR